MRLKLLFALAALIGLACAPVSAGPFRAGEDDVRAAYADYRAALFRTNQNDAAASRASIDAFRAKWSALATAWARQAPPQYADDPALGSTLQDVAATAEEAARLTEAGRLADAHEVLERIRDQLAALRMRNGIRSFSEPVNAYHEQMEKIVLGTYGSFSAEGLSALRDDVAVLDHLAAELGKPGPWNRPAGVDAALPPIRASIAAVRAALAGSDREALRAAIKALKPAFSRMFLQFG
ncbi:MAG: hypothetical protein FD152_1584 [Xanthobacteraceae bacterium]|nr:MAG: hypothetical protein FD152_1584 [Xanthobacteraceae bacterium]